MLYKSSGHSVCLSGTICWRHKTKWAWIHSQGYKFSFVWTKVWFYTELEGLAATGKTIEPSQVYWSDLSRTWQRWSLSNRGKEEHQHQLHYFFLSVRSALHVKYSRASTSCISIKSSEKSFSLKPQAQAVSSVYAMSICGINVELRDALQRQQPKDL